jgi:hypothetical protein
MHSRSHDKGPQASMGVIVDAVIPSIVRKYRGAKKRLATGRFGSIVLKNSAMNAAGAAAPRG